jgi:hypothetical protein
MFWKNGNGGDEIGNGVICGFEYEIKRIVRLKETKSTEIHHDPIRFSGRRPRSFSLFVGKVLLLCLRKTDASITICRSCNDRTPSRKVTEILCPLMCEGTCSATAEDRR